MEIVEEIEPNITPVQEKAMALRGYLLDDYKGRPSIEQIKRLEEGITYRLLSKFDRRGVEKFLDKAHSKGGAGLNRRTAKKFARELEILLMK